jgi:hypothetical protein
VTRRKKIAAVPMPISLSRMEQQEQTWVTSTEEIMRTADFARGVADKRSGRPPAFETYNFYQGESDQAVEAKINGLWNYERGRQWACLAPPSMPLNINGKLNHKAVWLCDTAFNRKYLV